MGRVSPIAAGPDTIGCQGGRGFDSGAIGGAFAALIGTRCGRRGRPLGVIAGAAVPVRVSSAGMQVRPPRTSWMHT
eukprot:8945054-Pyramimonas_sp.AAC.1